MGGSLSHMQTKRSAAGYFVHVMPVGQMPSSQTRKHEGVVVADEMQSASCPVVPRGQSRPPSQGTAHMQALQ
jgi:hypothetical protein